MPFAETQPATSPPDEFVQRMEIGALLDRYLIGLDEKEIDDTWATSLFTADACVEFPVGKHEGIDGLVAFHRTAMEKFVRTQHLNSGAVVDIEGGHATVRANLISTQVSHTRPDTAVTGPVSPPGSLFTTGTYVRGEARHAAHGWRFQRLSFQLVWATGEPPTLRN